ncbi:MAG: coiled-coil domain-containing protein [Planctomycetota bacterium]
MNRPRTIVGWALAPLLLSGLASAQDSPNERIKKLEEQFESYKKQAEIERRDLLKQLDELKQQLPSREPGANTNQALEDAVAELQVKISAMHERQTRAEASRGARAAYIDISYDALFTAGASQATDTELDIVQPGGHDPHQRGTTFVNGELSLQGAVDPYFKGNVHIIHFIDRAGETGVELEEAYLTTTQLPANLQLKAGHYFTEFGRLNRQHPHEWDFVDQPLINNRMFGGDGLRSPGARLSWLAPTPFFLELQSGIQNARGETVSSFLANDEVYGGITGSSGAEIPGSIGGHPFIKDAVKTLGDMLYTQRAAASFDLTDTSTILAGLSGLFGPNATGDDGHTEIYGFDFLYKWKPLNNESGWPFIKIQNEWMWRNIHTDSVNADLDGDSINEVFTSKNYKDWGTYAQVLAGFARPWVAGFRIDWVDGDGASTGGTGLLDRRIRLSPNITYYPSEFSKIRLQANFDKLQELGDHRFTSIWLQFEILFGSHGAHKF